MKVQVELKAFGEKGQYRLVDIPDEEARGKPWSYICELAFHYGQNDRQPQAVRSVSAGDVVILGGIRYVCMAAGWAPIGLGKPNGDFRQGRLL